MEKRFVTFFILSFLLFYAYSIYMKQFQPEVTPAQAPAGQASPAETRSTPQPAGIGRDTSARPAVTPAPKVLLPPAETTVLNTEEFEVEFTTRGAVPQRWDVIDPRFLTESLEEAQARGEDKAREPLIDPELRGLEGVPRAFDLILKELNGRFYNALNDSVYAYQPIQEDGRNIGYRFTSPSIESGLVATKTYRFDPEGFTGRFEVELVNEGASNLTFNDGNTGLGVVLGPGLGIPESDGAMARIWKVDAVLKRGDHFEFKHLKDAGDQEFYAASSYDWGSIVSMYFIAALIPDSDNPIVSAQAFAHRKLIGPVADSKTIRHYPAIELYSEPFTLTPGGSRTFGYEFFIGPKQQKVLHNAGHDFSRIFFFDSWGWFRALCLGLMSLLTWFHGLVGNWGVSIILLTVTVRLVTFPFVHKGMKAQAKSMAEQQRLKPLIDKINEKFKNDPQRKQQEVFKLYKEHGVNPLGMLKGCGWMLIQFPIFIALYRLLYQSIDLRGAGFLWIRDLSHADMTFLMKTSFPLIGNEINILPFVVAITQMLSSKLMQTPSTDPQQQQMQKMMIYLMPVFILFITYRFPAGLMIYWFISSLWQILQQMWVNKHIKKPEPIGATVTTVAPVKSKNP